MVVVVVAQRIEAPTLVVPASTPIATPASATLYDRIGIVRRLEIFVPPGPSGLVGFSFWHSSEQIIPLPRGTWIVTDNEVVKWDLDGYSPQPDWHIKAYNLDGFAHTLQVRVLLDEPPLPLETLPTPGIVE